MSVLDEQIHHDLRESVRYFVEKEVKPFAFKLGNSDGEIPSDIIRKMSELGYLGLIFPKEWDGSELDVVAMAIVTEELARGWLSVASVVTRAIITGSLLLNHGTAEQKKKWLSRIAKGQILTAAAITEPDVGSDVASIALRAVEKDQHYFLSGPKTWCTFADRAHLLTVVGRVHPNPVAGHKGLSIFLLEKEPGPHFFPPQLMGSAIPTVGYHGSHSFSLNFDQVEIPRGNLLGETPGLGFKQMMSTFELSRIQTAARAVGVAQAALDEAITYAKQRSQFGTKLANHQVIRHKIATMSTKVEAARQLCLHAARIKSAGGRSDLAAGSAKVFAAEMAEWVTSEALQVFGGYGYSTEFPVQMYWRDARVFRVFEGTSEIQYEVIAKQIFQS